DGDGALGRRGARPRLRGPLRREPRRGRVGAREGTRRRGPGGHLRPDRPRRQPGRGGGGGNAVRGGVPGADVTPAASSRARDASTASSASTLPTSERAGA